MRMNIVRLRSAEAAENQPPWPPSALNTAAGSNHDPNNSNDEDKEALLEMAPSSRHSWLPRTGPPSPPSSPRRQRQLLHRVAAYHVLPSVEASPRSALASPSRSDDADPSSSSSDETDDMADMTSDPIMLIRELIKSKKETEDYLKCKLESSYQRIRDLQAEQHRYSDYFDEQGTAWNKERMKLQEEKGRLMAHIDHQGVQVTILTEAINKIAAAVHFRSGPADNSKSLL